MSRPGKPRSRRACAAVKTHQKERFDAAIWRQNNLRALINITKPNEETKRILRLEQTFRANKAKETFEKFRTNHMSGLGAKCSAPCPATSKDAAPGTLSAGNPAEFEHTVRQVKPLHDEWGLQAPAPVVGQSLQDEAVTHGPEAGGGQYAPKVSGESGQNPWALTGPQNHGLTLPPS